MFPPRFFFSSFPLWGRGRRIVPRRPPGSCQKDGKMLVADLHLFCPSCRAFQQHDSSCCPTCKGAPKSTLQDWKSRSSVTGSPLRLRQISPLERPLIERRVKSLIKARPHCREGCVPIRQRPLTLDTLCPRCHHGPPECNTLRPPPPATIGFLPMAARSVPPKAPPDHPTQWG